MIDPGWFMCGVASVGVAVQLVISGLGAASAHGAMKENLSILDRRVGALETTSSEHGERIATVEGKMQRKQVHPNGAY